MILAAIFTFISGILEIPTGVVGDKLGYKKTLFLASFFILIGAIIYIPARTFFHIIIADIFWAIGFAFNSGTSTSFIYDTLKNLKKEKEFKKINGVSNFLFWSGLAIGSIIGGFLAKTSLRLPVVLSFIPLIIPSLIALSFIEPKRIKSKLSHFRHIKKSIKHILSKKRLHFFLWFGTAAFFLTDAPYRFFQPLLRSVDIPIALFGIIFAFGYLISGFGALISHKIEELFKERNSLLGILLIGFLALLFISLLNSKLVIIFVLIILVVGGIQWPIITDYFNKEVESHNRATVNSISSLTSTITIGLSLVLLGYLGDLYSLNFVFFIESIVVLICLILFSIWYYFLNKNSPIIKSSQNIPHNNIYKQ